MHLTRSTILKTVAIIFSVLLISTCLEAFYFNYHALRYGGSVEMDSQSILAHSTGFTQIGDAVVPIQENAVIDYQFQNRYFSKIILEYEATDDKDMTMLLGSNDSSGDEEIITIVDAYNQKLTRAVSNINAHIHSLNIMFPTQLITIKTIHLVNDFNFNIIRFLFMCTTGFLFAFILFSRKILAEKVELTFLVTALAIGILMIVLIPLKNPIVWDDDTHFHRIYEQSFATHVVWTQATADYDKRLVPAANTIEEKSDVIDLLNSENNFDQPVASSEKSIYIPYAFRCYIPQSLTMGLARNLNFDFNSMQSLTRFVGFLCYVLAVYGAIRMAPFGKRIIAVVALMPTPLFMAANFSYDPVVIGFVFLAFSAFLAEYFDRDHKISMKRTAIFLGAILIASCTKAVYIPLILVAFLLPAEKFHSKRNMYFFRLGIFAILMTIMATFVLPTVINPSTSGDLRGGATSVSGQLSFILGDPLFYTRLLFKSMWDSLGSYMLGNSTLINFAYLGVSNNNAGYAAIALILFALFTDSVRDDKFGFKPAAKIYVFAILFSVICLVWTALYVAFTPVGEDQILGVQSRYYLPLIVPILYMIRTTKIETKISPLVLNRIVFAGCAFVALFTIYDFILKPFNF